MEPFDSLVGLAEERIDACLPIRDAAAPSREPFDRAIE
jgi:hypothetical protein